MRSILAAGTILLVMGLICSMAYGEEPDSNDNWQFSLAPMYLWAVNLDADLTVKVINQTVEADFGQRGIGVPSASCYLSCIGLQGTQCSHTPVIYQSCRFFTVGSSWPWLF